MKPRTEDVMSARKKDGTKYLNEKTGKPERRKVAEANWTEYESFAELVTAIGEADVLKFSNAQIATNAKNKARGEAVGGISETELVRQAMLRMTQPQNLAKIAALQTQSGGDQKLYEALFMQYQAELVDEIKKEKADTAIDDPEETA